jgi:integrase
MLRESNARQGFFESEVFEKVRAELPDYLYGVATFAYYTGWRKAEIVGLRWRQVDLAHAEVRLDPGATKNGEGRALFLEGELREMLERLWEKRAPGCEYVFARQGRSVGDFKKAWESACRRAGFPGMLFHDLRRTAVRNMVRAGVPERVAMQITGHKTRAIFDHYHIVSEADLREAAWKLAAWNGAVHADAAGDGDKPGYNAPGEQMGRDAKVF